MSRRLISRLIRQAFFLGQAVDIAAVAHALQALQFLDALADGAPVGEHAAQPALGDIGHAAAHGFFLDGFLRLALGANEQDGAALSDGVAHQVVGLFSDLTVCCRSMIWMPLRSVKI